MAKKTNLNLDKEALKKLLNRFPKDQVSHDTLRDGVEDLQAGGLVNSGDDEADKLVNDLANDLKKSKTEDDLKHIAKRLENAHTKLETIQRNMRTAKNVTKGLVENSSKNTEDIQDIKTNIADIKEHLATSKDSNDDKKAEEAIQQSTNQHQKVQQNIRNIQRLVVVQMQQYHKHAAVQKQNTVVGLRRIISKGFNFDVGNMLIGMSGGDPGVIYAVNTLGRLFKRRRGGHGGQNQNQGRAINESSTKTTITAMEQEQKIGTGIDTGAPGETSPSASPLGSNASEQLASISGTLAEISTDVKTLVRISLAKEQSDNAQRMQNLENTFEEGLGKQTDFPGKKADPNQTGKQQTKSILKRITDAAMTLLGGTALAGALGSVGKFAVSPVTMIAGGILWSAIDGIMGYFKSDQWGTSKISGFIGGFFGGSLNSKVLNVVSNMGKWAAIGAGLGSVFPVVGTLLGGLIGAGLGGILGFFGGAKIAQFVDREANLIGQGISYVAGEIKNVVMHLFEGTLNAFKQIKETVAGWIDWVKNKFKNLFGFGDDEAETPIAAGQGALIGMQGGAKLSESPQMPNETPEQFESRKKAVAQKKIRVYKEQLTKMKSDESRSSRLSRLNSRKLTRGLRNNNPGNIRHGINWAGLSGEQNDPNFASFKTPELGIRAMTKNLINYKMKHQVTTLREVVSKWAPSNENNTGAYISAVSKATGIAPDQKIDLANPQVLQRVIPAIIAHENGGNPFSPDQVNTGIQLALGGATSPSLAGGIPMRQDLGAQVAKITKNIQESQNVSYVNYAPVNKVTNNNNMGRGGKGTEKTGQPGTNTLQRSIAARL